VPIHDGLADRERTPAGADPAVIDELVAFWELQPRVAFRDAVRRHLRRALDSTCARRGITCLSNWAASATIDEIARSPLRELLRVRPPDRPGALDHWLHRQAAESGVMLASDDAVPDAGVVVAFGSFALTPCADLSMLLHGVRRRCAPDAVVVWSHSLVRPGRAQYVRSAFEKLFGTVEVEVVGSGPESGQWYVGSAWTPGAAAGVQP
jgi:hypothetical protein